MALVNQGVQPGNSPFIDKLPSSDVLLAHTSALQRQDTLLWPSSQENTQSMHPARSRKPVAAMQAGDASPGSEDTPMPIRRPTGVQMDFRQRPTIPVSTQQVSYDDRPLSTRLSRATGAHAELLMGQADQMPSADMTSRDTLPRPLPPGLEFQLQHTIPLGTQCDEFCTPSVSTHLPRATGNPVEFLQCTPPMHTGLVDHTNDFACRCGCMHTSSS